jgi:hypothetical protein
MDRHEQLVALTIVNNWDNNVLASVLEISPGAVKDAIAGRYRYSKAYEKLINMYEGEGVRAIVAECCDQKLWSDLNTASGRGPFEASLDYITSMPELEFSAWAGKNTNWRLRYRNTRKFRHNDKIALMAVILWNERLKRRERHRYAKTMRRLPPDETLTYPDWLIGQVFGCSTRVISHVRNGAGEYATILRSAEDMGIDAFISRNMTDRIVNKLRYQCDIETGTPVPLSLPAKVE